VISADYQIASGTYADGDVGAYIIADPAGTPVVIQPAGFQMQSLGSGTKGRLVATFQTQATGQAYRLCFHVASTSAQAYSIAIDTVQVGPQNVTFSTPVTDWVSYTPTILNHGTVTVSFAEWKQVGDTMLVRGRAALATPSASVLRISLPNGYSGKNSLVDCVLNGTATTNYTGGTQSGLVPIFKSASPTTISFSLNNSPRNGFDELAGNVILANGSTITWTAEIPIQGWSSSAQVVSDSSEGRVVAFRGQNTAGTSIPNNSFTNVPFTSQRDTVGGWDNANTYVTRVPGDYNISATVRFTANGTGDRGVRILFNGNVIAENYQRQGGGFGDTVTATAQPTLPAGSLIVVQAFQTSGGALTLVTGVGANMLNIALIQGSQTLLGGETVAARYTTTTANNVVTDTAMSYETRDFDDTLSFTSNTTWTAPISGKYRISQRITTGAATATAIGNTVGSRLNVNGGGSGIWLCRYVTETTTSVQKSMFGQATVRLLAGQTVSINGFNNTGQTHSLATGAGENYIEIERIGNY
jgi:hypothetical protein